MGDLQIAETCCASRGISNIRFQSSGQNRKVERPAQPSFPRTMKGTDVWEVHLQHHMSPSKHCVFRTPPTPDPAVDSRINAGRLPGFPDGVRGPGAGELLPGANLARSRTVCVERERSAACRSKRCDLWDLKKHAGRAGVPNWHSRTKVS